MIRGCLAILSHLASQTLAGSRGYSKNWETGCNKVWPRDAPDVWSPEEHLLPGAKLGGNDRQAGTGPWGHFIVSGFLKGLNVMECEPAEVSFFPAIAFNCALILALCSIMGRFHTFWPLSVMDNFSLVIL